MQIPSNILLSNWKPSRYLPALEIIWCILTIAMACVQSVHGVYVIRFLLGLAEAGFYPGVNSYLFNINGLLAYLISVFYLLDYISNWNMVHKEGIGETIGFSNYMRIIREWSKWCCTSRHVENT